MIFLNNIYIIMELIDAAVSNDYDEVKRLLESGADPDFQDFSGNTALIYAARNSNKMMIKLLIENGANPYLSNDDDISAEDIAMHQPDATWKAINEGMDKFDENMDLAIYDKNLAFLSGMYQPRLGYDSPLRYLNLHTKNYLNNYLESRLPYVMEEFDPTLIKKIVNERRMDPLTKSKQRLATMRGFSDYNSMFGYLDENIARNISRHLEDYKPDIEVQHRMMLEDIQRGRGKRSSKKHNKKVAKRTKKRRNCKNRY